MEMEGWKIVNRHGLYVLYLCSIEPDAPIGVIMGFKVKITVYKLSGYNIPNYNFPNIVKMHCNTLKILIFNTYAGNFLNLWWSKL